MKMHQSNFFKTKIKGPSFKGKKKKKLNFGERGYKLGRRIQGDALREISSIS